MAIKKRLHTHTHIHKWLKLNEISLSFRIRNMKMRNIVLWKFITFSSRRFLSFTSYISFFLEKINLTIYIRVFFFASCILRDLPFIYNRIYVFQKGTKKNEEI